MILRNINSSWSHQRWPPVFGWSAPRLHPNEFFLLSSTFGSTILPTLFETSPKMVFSAFVPFSWNAPIEITSRQSWRLFMCLTIVERTIGFEKNMEGNNRRKLEKCKSLKSNLLTKYDGVHYVNVSMSVCVLEKDIFFELLRCFRVPGNEIIFLTRRMTNLCIRSLYFIFLRRNKEWNLYSEAFNDISGFLKTFWS